MGIGFAAIPMITFFLVWITVFVFIFRVAIKNIGKGVAETRANRNASLITADATVIAKRMHVFGDHSRTYYYVTFEFIDRRRLELKVPDDQYGYMIEGDVGALSYQGTMFVSFVNHNNF